LTVKDLFFQILAIFVNISVNTSINFQQISSSENDELQHSMLYVQWIINSIGIVLDDNVMHDMADKRQHDDDGNMGE